MKRLLKTIDTWGISFLLVAGFIIFFAFNAFQSPCFFDVDSYYHISIAKWLGKNGLHHSFPWAEFTFFKRHFSDKDLLFHLILIPFSYLSRDPVFCGKIALIFFQSLFLTYYSFLLKKYLNNILYSCLIFLPFCSVSFFISFLHLRPAILANLILVSAIYSTIHGKKKTLFVLSFLYSWAHISFFILIPIVVLIECFRYYYQKQFRYQTLLYVVLGICVGGISHPGFPYNFKYMFINGILVPYKTTFTGTSLVFAQEFFPLTSKELMFQNFFMFISLLLIFIKLISGSFSGKYPTLVWGGIFISFLFLGFLSKRYLYEANILFYVFFASFLKDWLGGKEKKSHITFFVFVYLLIVIVLMPRQLKRVKMETDYFAQVNNHYKTVANFMKENIPKGEIVFHSSFSDTPRLMCYNPDNRYLVVLDPIYMMLFNSSLFGFYEKIKNGQLANPTKYINHYFLCKYGYSRKIYPFFSQLKNDPSVQFLYEDDIGVVFKIILR